MRLTADLIERARSRVNPLRQRELDLRGYKIPVIENLGATLDAYDSIDLSDNEAKKLDNIPLLKELVTLLLANNHISRIGSGLGACLPKLDMLVLTNNRVVNLSEIDGLAELPSIRELSLLGNPVTRRPHYRAYVIHKIPSLRVLDFVKIKEKERIAASELFESETGRALEEEAEKARTFTPGEVAEEAKVEAKPTLTPAQLAILTQAIEEAPTAAEVDRIGEFMKAGKMPPELEEKASAGGESAAKA